LNLKKKIFFFFFRFIIVTLFGFFGTEKTIKKNGIFKD